MDPIIALIAIILGGGPILAYVAFKKAGPETEQVSVQVLRGVIEELRRELERLTEDRQTDRERIAVLEDRDEARGTQIEELKSAQGPIRDIFDKLPAAVYEIEPGPERRFLFVSREAKDLTGWNPSEWLRNPNFWIEQIHPDDRARVRAHVARQDRDPSEGAREEIAYRIMRPDGEAVPVRNVGVLVSKHGGLVWRGVLLPVQHNGESVDLTERHS